MSALDELKEKQARGEQLTSLEFTTWWCTDTVAAGHAAEELAALRAERDEAVRLLSSLSERFVSHRDGCNGITCTCGLSKIMADWVEFDNKIANLNP